MFNRVSVYVLMLSVATTTYAPAAEANVKKLLGALWERVMPKAEKSVAKPTGKSGAKPGAKPNAKVLTPKAQAAIKAKKAAEENIDLVLKQGGKVSITRVGQYREDELANATAGLLFNTYKRVKDQVYGKTLARDKEVDQALRGILSRSSDGVIVEGYRGVGKSHVAYGLQERIHEGMVPDELLNAQVISVNLGHPSLINGSASSATLSDDALLASLKSIPKLQIPGKDKEPTLILHLQGLDLLQARFAEGNAANFLDQIIDSVNRGYRTREVKFIVEMDRAQSMVVKRQNPALARFTSVEVQKLSDSTVRQIVANYARGIEEDHGVEIPAAVVAKSIDVAKRFYADMAMPEAAIRLLDEAAITKKVVNSNQVSAYSREVAEEIVEMKDTLARAKTLKGREARRLVKVLPDQISAKQAVVNKIDANYKEIQKHQARLKAISEQYVVGKKPNAKIPTEVAEEIRELKRKINTVGEQDLAFSVHLERKIPVADVMGRTKLTVENIKTLLSQKLIGQEHAVEELATYAARAKAEFRLDRNAPAGSIVLSGGPGSGKTSGAIELANVAFGGRIVRLDMIEYKEAHSVSKVLGAPPGYVGYDATNDIVSQIQKQCSEGCVLLLDEIEKAHPEVLKSFLTAVGEGRLSNGRGDTANLSNVVVAMTTNAVQDAPATASMSHMKSLLGQRTGMPPEMLNRLENVVQFNKITLEVAGHIMDRFVYEFNKNELAPKLIRLKLLPGAKNFFLTKFKMGMKEAEEAAKATKSPAQLDKTARDIKVNFKRFIEDQINSARSTGEYVTSKGRRRELTIKDGDLVIVRNEGSGLVIEVAK